MTLSDDEIRPLGTPLYHYTSVEVLQKIYETRKLHATHAAYFNDGSEIRLGLQVLWDLIETKIKTATGRELGFLTWLRDFVRAESWSFPRVFMLCFSEQRNLLSQWRGYTPPGRGVCIGFRHDMLTMRAQRAGWQWLSCSYLEASHRSWMGAYLSLFLKEALENVDICSVDEVARTVWERNVAHLFACAAHVKDKAFAEEREWRFVSPPTMTQDKSVKFRVGRYSLVPFLEFDLIDAELPTLPLYEIVVGPTPDPRSALHAIMSMQLSVRYSDHTRVEPSGIPYREI